MAAHPKFNWKLFAQQLRQWRGVDGLGLREAARRQGIGHASWCRAEQGKPVTVPIFLALCKYMDADPFGYCRKRL